MSTDPAPPTAPAAPANPTAPTGPAAGTIAPPADAAGTPDAKPGPILNPVSKKAGAVGTTGAPPTDLEAYTNSLVPVLQKYGRLIGLTILAVILLVISVLFWQSRGTAAREAGWGELFTAESAEGYRNVAEIEASTGAAPWARVWAGQSYFAEGMNLVFRDTEGAKASFKLARENFQAALDGDGPDDVRVRALYGLAGVAEAEGDADGARERLTRIVEDYPDSPLVPAAETKLDTLAAGGTDAFLAWLAEQNFRTEDLARPLDSPAAPDEPVLPTLDEEDDTAPPADPAAEAEPAADAEPTDDPESAAETQPAAEAGSDDGE